MIDRLRFVVGVTLVVGAFIGGMRTMAKIADANEAKAAAAAAKQQEAQAKKMAAEVAAAREEKDEALRTVNARLADALVRLRQRPERMQEPARKACEGATGQELAAGDAEFLSRYAARAAEQEAALSECYSWIDAVKTEYQAH